MANLNKNLIPLWLVIIVFLIAGLTIFLLNRFAYQTLPEDPNHRAEAFIYAGLPDKAEAVYIKILTSDPLNPEINTAYIRNHFSLQDNRSEVQDFAEQYQSLATHTTSADIGHFGLGLIHAMQKNYSQALDEYQMVKDRDIKYLNYAIGSAYLEIGNPEQAEIYLRQEILLDGDLAEATRLLAFIYIERNQPAQLETLLSNARTAPYVDRRARSHLALQNREIINYLALTFIKPFASLTLPAIFNAILICLVWLIFIRRINVFRQEPLVKYFVILFSGVAVTLWALVFDDFLCFLVPWREAQTWHGELLTAVVNIGLVEETVKLTPVILIVLLSRHVNEPANLLIYGSLSALGFATLENALYFSQQGLGIVYPRYLYSTSMHVAMTSIICYSWAKAYIYHSSDIFKRVVTGLIVAAIIHGLFDYFLQYKDGIQLMGIALALHLVIIHEYYRMLRNVLNYSPPFNEEQARSLGLSNAALFLSAAAIFITITFIFTNSAFATEIANRQIATLMLGTMPSILALSVFLGKLRLKTGGWIPILPVFRFQRKLPTG